MGFFKKIGGAVKKLARSKIVLGALNTATGGLSGKAISVAKGLGAVMKGGRPMKKQSKSLSMPLAKAASEPIYPPTIEPLQVRDITPSRAPTRKRRKKADMSDSGVKSMTPAQRKKAKKAARAATGGAKRKPPGGGLDLAKMAVEWKKAGKPGTWQGWIKSNPIRRPK